MLLCCGDLLDQTGQSGFRPLYPTANAQTWESARDTPRMFFHKFEITRRSGAIMQRGFSAMASSQVSACVCSTPHIVS
jgi:hypothetical protein